MELLVASVNDPAGMNMAESLYGDRLEAGQILSCDGFDLMAVHGPTIEADSIEASLPKTYEGILFLSKHMAVSGKLALTCHSTGNFSKAQAGGNDGQVAVPHSQMIKRHICALWDHRSEFEGFDLTLEATHHGPTALRTPSAFIEVGTTEAQWNDRILCGKVASILRDALLESKTPSPSAICFGGNHYPSKFTCEALHGEFATGTIVPKHALEHIDEAMMSHICAQNPDARVALLDSKGLGTYKRRILELLSYTDLEVIAL